MIQLIAIKTGPRHWVITTTDMRHKYGPDFLEIKKGITNWIEDIGLDKARKELADG